MLIELIIIIALSYLAGSIPASIIVSKVFAGIDIREHGSRNAGAANVIRVLGVKFGIIVLLFDIFKGFISVFWFAKLIKPDFFDSGEMVCIAAGTAAVIGHIFPIFAKFKGGKGVATYLGMTLAISPLAAGLFIASYIVVMLITKTSSLGSIISSFLMPFNLILLDKVFNIYVSSEFFYYAIFAAAFIIFMHRENISRLIKGTENRL